MFRLAIALPVLLAFTSLLSAADWPQWLGPKRNGGSVEKVEPWKEGETPKKLWSAKVGVGFSAPVVVGERVFIHARVGRKEREEMIAFNAKDGTELWRTPYERAPYSSVLNTGPQATPTVSGNRVYCFGITGMLTCFAADSGKQLWQVDTFKLLKAELPRFGVCCSPLVIGNRVLVAVNGKGSSVAAFDIESGELQWQSLDEPASTSSPVLFTMKGKAGALPDAVFMTTLRIVGLNPLDGTVNWEFPLPFQPAGTSPTPLLAGDLLITSTMTNGSTAIRVKPGEGDKPTVEKVWQAKEQSGYFSTGTATKDRAFLVVNETKPVPRTDLACVDLTSGKQLWKKEGLGYFHFGVVRTANDKLLILGDDGTLRLVDATAKEYRELCSAKVCDGTLVVPTLSGGRVYVRDGEQVICLQLNP